MVNSNIFLPPSYSERRRKAVTTQSKNINDLSYDKVSIILATVVFKKVWKNLKVLYYNKYRLRDG